MTDCRHCGARLTLGMRWCWQCYTPIPAVVGAPTKESWGDDVKIVPGAPPTRSIERIVVVPDLERPSIWRPGPTTFGIVGKLVVTVLVTGVGALAAWLAGLWVDMAGTAGLAFLVFMIGLYSIAAFIVLRSVWAVERPMRPARLRRERIIYVGHLDSIKPTVEPAKQAEQKSRPVV